MALWAWCKGKANERTLAQPASAGATQVELSAGGDAFAPGDLVFVSDDDGGRPEFLGSVVDHTGPVVAFGQTLRVARSAGAAMWRAAQGMAFVAEAGPPLRATFDPGLAVERSAGGVVFSTLISAPRSRVELELRGMTPVVEAALPTGLLSATQGGVGAFTLIDPSRRLLAARLDAGEWTRLGRPGERRELRLALLIEAENEFR